MGSRRHFDLLLHLFEHGTTTATDLADALCVSARTIRRDVLELGSEGVPIGMTRGKGGGVYLVSDDGSRCDGSSGDYFADVARHVVMRLDPDERSFVEGAFPAASFEDLPDGALSATFDGIVGEDALRLLVGRSATVFVESPIDMQVWLYLQARRAAQAYGAVRQ